MSSDLSKAEIDRLKHLLGAINTDKVNRIVYMIDDYSSEKNARKATPSLIDLKIQTYDDKLSLSLDKRELNLVKPLATIQALDRLEENLKSKINTLSDKVDEQGGSYGKRLEQVEKKVLVYGSIFAVIMFILTKPEIVLNLLGK